MNNSEDQILVRELGKVGSIVGPVGSFGTRFSARYLPTERFTASLRLEKDVRELLQTVFRVLTSMGKMTDEYAEPSGPPSLSAIVGSGFLGMNPTLLHVEVAAASDQVAEVNISAAAKEGLIKQRSAEKAVNKFKEELSKALLSH
jgi:hypothetical protein